ncbi:MAG: PAS domain S-box protein [Cytophagaceae bacterium]|nr:MAG: PAS domain S-box protein [Cytophagaceae bacterium]
MMPLDFRNLFYALPDKYLLLDANGIVLDLNDSHAASSLSGRSRAEVAGQHFLAVWPPNSEAAGNVVLNSHEQVRHTRQPHTMPLLRYDMPNADLPGGYEQRYWEATHYPVVAESGELRYILQRTEDVTARQLAEAQRAESQRQLAAEQERSRFILESVPVMVWTANTHGERDYFNPRWLEFTGRALEQELHQGWAESIYPDDRARVRALWAAAVAQGTPYQAEYRLRRPDGQHRWVLMRATPRRNAAGDTFWIGGGTDIHDQKLMVQELQETNERQAELAEQQYVAFKQLRNQRQDFYTMFMEVPALVCVLSGPSYRYTLVNAAYQRLFGSRELLGLPVAQALPELVNQGIIDLLANVYQTGQTYYGNEVLLHLATAEGSQRAAYFNFTYQRFEEAEGQAGILVFAYDVTGLVQARQALEALPGAARSAQ